jgi:cytochrome bd-type quinol oxidase subunit 2
MKKLFAVSSFGTTLMLWGVRVSVVLAQTAKSTSPVSDETDLQQLMCNIVDWFFWIVITVSVIMVLVAAFDYITAGDDTEKTSKARRTLTYAAVGIAVALLAAGFPRIVASVLPNTTPTSAEVSCLG